MDVRGAQFNGVLQHLIDEADDGGVVFGTGVEVVILGIFIHHRDGFFLVEGADGVSADAEALLHLALHGFGGGQHRLEIQAGEGFQGVKALGGKQAAGGDFHAAVDPLQGEDFLLQQNAGGKERE